MEAKNAQKRQRMFFSYSNKNSKISIWKIYLVRVVFITMLAAK